VTVAALRGEAGGESFLVYLLLDGRITHALEQAA